MTLDHLYNDIITNKKSRKLSIELSLFEEYSYGQKFIINSIESDFDKGVLKIIMEKKKQKGGAEAGFVAQLLFYPVTEQLFVFNESQVRCVPAGRKNKKRY